jgi:hypothetical protein
MDTTRFATLVTAALAIAPIGAAQSPKLLQITSPADGAIISPGSTMKVTVTSPANALFEAVVLLSPIGISGLITSVPAEIPLLVPRDIACRKYLVAVDGRTTSGQSTMEHVEVDVERADTPLQLSFLNHTRQLEFVALGESLSMNVLATFPDGSILDVTESSRVTYRSSNTSVATVDGYGAITPAGVGRASVTAIYTNDGRTVRVAIPVSVPELVLTASSRALAFDEQAIGTTSTPRQLTLTNTSHGPLDVVEIEMGSQDFTETDDCSASTPLPVGSSCTILVSFKPTEAGQRPGTLRVSNSFTASPDVISLSGVGRE